MRENKKYIKIFSYNALIFIIGIVLIELIFGSWIFGTNFSSLPVKRNIIKVWEPKHYESEHKAMYKKDKYGFRGNYRNVSEIKILTVGGSTTDERWIDEKLTWSNLLQSHINSYQPRFEKLKIANAGIDGQSSIGSVKNFQNWFNKIENLKPDFFIFYLGINDAILLLVEDNKHPKKKKSYNISDELKENNLTDRFTRYVKNNSSIYSLYKIIEGNIIARKYGAIHGTTTWKNSLEKKNIIIDKNKKVVRKFLNDYENRLLLLKKNSNSYNANLIIMTQRVPTGHFLENALDLINKQTESFCLKTQSRCFFLHKELTFDVEKDLYDAYHTRPLGNKKIANFIFQKMKILLND